MENNISFISLLTDTEQRSFVTDSDLSTFLTDTLSTDTEPNTSDSKINETTIPEIIIS